MMARSTGMRGFALLHVAALAGALGCAQGTADKAPEPNTAIEPFSHAAAPDDVVHSTFIDFGGKVAIVGWSASPSGEAAPASAVKLTLYWKRTGELEPGWGIFTHLEDGRGKQLMNLDQESPFRKALVGNPGGVEMMDLGRVYTDELTFQMPKAGDLTPRVMLAVGVWNIDWYKNHDQYAIRLPVVSGPSNGHGSAIVTYFDTGVPWQTRVVRLDQRK
jgi:hypothetical protein